jgi:hypothetical protein
LLRLKQHLEENGCQVVYFAADEEDIDPEDAQYTDILLACTRHLLQDLKQADPKPLLGWLSERWQDLKELALTEISFESSEIEMQLDQFTKLTASVRAVPSQRQKIREKVNPHTVTLLKALNEFIKDAKHKLPQGKTKLVVIADNLDRIASVKDESGGTNHDDIFLERSQQLRGLDCHVVYTIPISMVYSRRANDLREIYDNDPLVLPMIMVQLKDGNTCEQGLTQVREIIARRVNNISDNLNLESQVFENSEVLRKLCLISGGHVRNLMLLIRSAFDHVDHLPITQQAAQRAITQARDTYRRTVQEQQWSLLAEVHRTKQIKNNDDYRQLLFNRCILQYRYFDEEGECQAWYDVHPLIKNIQEFKSAL